MNIHNSFSSLGGHSWKATLSVNTFPSLFCTLQSCVTRSILNNSDWVVNPSKIRSQIEANDVFIRKPPAQNFRVSTQTLTSKTLHVYSIFISEKDLRIYLKSQGDQNELVLTPWMAFCLSLALHFHFQHEFQTNFIRLSGQGDVGSSVEGGMSCVNSMLFDFLPTPPKLILGCFVDFTS